MLGGEGCSNVLCEYDRVKHVYGIALGLRALGRKGVCQLWIMSRWHLGGICLYTLVCRTASRSLRQVR